MRVALLPERLELTIAEGTLLADDLPMFSAGSLLAVMHADGTIHGDFHLANLRFVVETGATIPIDLSAGTPDELTALHAAYDFVAPCLTMSAGRLSALLLGYGKALAMRSAAAELAPEDVFALVGTTVDYRMRVDPEPRTALRLLECIDVNADGAVVRARGREPGRWRSCSSVNRAGRARLRSRSLSYTTTPVHCGRS